MPFWIHRPQHERLFWARGDQFARSVADAAPGSHLVDLDAGWCVIGPAATLGDVVVAGLAAGRPYGLVTVNPAAPAPDRYLHALTDAVQQSGIADRIGMDQSPLVAAGEAPRLLLHAPEPPSRRLPAARGSPDPPHRRVGMPLPARDADAPPIDQRHRRRGDRDGALGRPRPVHRGADPCPHRRDRGPRPAAAPARRHQLRAGEPPRPPLQPADPRQPGPRGRHLAAPGHPGVHGAAGDPRRRAPQARRPGPAPARLRRRRGRRRRRVRLVHAHRGPPAQRHQDRPRDRPGERPERREARPHRGVRRLRPAHRCPAGRRGHREALGPRRPRGRRRRPGAGLPAGARRRRAAGASCRAAWRPAFEALGTLWPAPAPVGPALLVRPAD